MELANDRNKPAFATCFQCQANASKNTMIAQIHIFLSKSDLSLRDQQPDKFLYLNCRASDVTRNTKPGSRFCDTQVQNASMLGNTTQKGKGSSKSLILLPLELAAKLMQKENET